jgi:acyl-CoA thioesterase
MAIDLEKIRSFFAADRFAAGAGITIDDVREDGEGGSRVVCGMEISASHRNAGGGVQGGAIFTLADLAFAVHSNLDMLQGADVGITVGQSCSISYLRAARGGRLIAESACLSRGRNMAVYRITVKDDQGTLVAEMLGNGFITAKK